MKVKILTPFLFLLVFFSTPRLTRAQCDMSYTLDTQLAVDTFTKTVNGCSHLEGGLTISGDVSNLEPLSFLTKVASLNVSINMYNGMPGLHNITTSDWVSFGGGGEISGLETMTSLTNVRVIQLNGNPFSCVGPPNIVELEHLYINIKSAIPLEGFDGLKKVTSSIEFLSSTIIDVLGFNNLEFVGTEFFDGLSINSCPSLVDISGFNGPLNHLQRMQVNQCNSLIDISGFNQVKEIQSSIYIIRNDNLIDVSGFNNFEKIGRSIEWSFNQSMKDVPILRGVKEVVNTLWIENNDSLESLSGLENLEQVGWLSFNNNPNLTDCDGYLCKLSVTDPVAVENITLSGNGMECFSSTDLITSCSNSPSGYVWNVGIDTITGASIEKELSNALVTLIHNGNFIDTVRTDEQGYFEIDSVFPFSQEPNFSFKVTHSSQPFLAYYDTLSQEDFLDHIEIDLPLQAIEQAALYEKKLETMKVKLSAFGGGFTTVKELEAYDLEPMQLYILDSIFVLDGNHDRRVEILQRMVVGYYLASSYLNFGVDYSSKVPKAIYDAGKAAFDLNSLWNSSDGLAKSIKDFLKDNPDIDEDSKKQFALNKLLLSGIQSELHIIKKHILNPYLASFGPSAEEQAFVKNINAMIFVIEKVVATGSFKDAAIEIAREGFFALGSLKLAQQYVSNTEDIFEEIYYESLDNQGNVKEATRAINMTISETVEQNNVSEEWVDNLSNNVADINAFTGVADAAAFASLLTGFGAPLAPFIAGVSKGLKAAGILFSVAIAPIYAYRYLALPSELEWGVEQISKRKFESYPPGYFDEKLAALVLHLNVAEADILAFQNSLLSEDVEEVSDGYLTYVASRSLDDQLEKTSHYFNAISSYGINRDTIMENYVEGSECFLNIKYRREAIDLLMLAYYMDTTALSIRDDISLELDTLISMHDELLDKLAIVFEEAQDEVFEPIIALAQHSYPDSLVENTFVADLTIENFGPAASETFSIDMEVSPSLLLTGINEGDSALSMINLSAGEKMDLKLSFEVLDFDVPKGVFLDFVGEKGLSTSITFNFTNVDIANTSSVATVDIENSSLTVFPNPGDQILNVNLKDGQAEIYEIFDVNGVLVSRSTMTKIDIRNYKSGLYIIRALYEGEFHTSTFIKQ